MLVDVLIEALGIGVEAVKTLQRVSRHQLSLIPFILTYKANPNGLRWIVCDCAKQTTITSSSM
jgi:hypothetical protein